MMFNYTVLEKFIKYVQIDTQSDYYSKNTPSTNKQKTLSVLLVKELKDMGIENAYLDEFGYVYAKLLSNSFKKVPKICFCSHVDTSPDCSGANVKPIIHQNYDGKDIILPDDADVIIKLKDHPDLANQIGNDIVTASGLTLLGADNKAGVAEIMDAMRFLVQNPNLKHGEVSILFTPDEEIGRGVDHVDMKKVDADFGYTIDGEMAGTFEDETFSANGFSVTINGISAHPGFAKGKMKSAIKIAAEVVMALPKNRLSPESTSGKDGFVHPTNISGTVEQAKIDFIIRDFIDENLLKHEQELIQITNKVIEKYSDVAVSYESKNQYRNMKAVVNQHPEISEYALLAIERAGLNPIKRSIRGGTDGSRLSFMGLPCPNIFAGEHAFHSKQEWVSVQDMEAAVRTIVNLALIWEEKS
jgi:tripeptide aminopeptidase